MRLAAALVLALAAPAAAESSPSQCMAGVSGAMYNRQTDSYGHAVLGERSEWETLTVFVQLQLPCRAGGMSITVAAGPDLVFEDVAPALADLTGDGEPEVVTVESHRDRGARLTVWTRAGTGMRRLAATPFLGTRHRWIAQAGVADLDSDGVPEIAAIDRPHLDGVLRLWRLEGGLLVEVASAAGFTNHRFGEAAMLGGIRACGGSRDLVLATADWRRLVAVSWDGAILSTREVGTDTSAEAFAAAMGCG